MRQRLTTLVFLLPPSGLKNRLLRTLGHAVPASARVGINLVQRVDRFELGEGTVIHHFNWFRDLRLVKTGTGCRILLFNWFTGDSGFEPGMEQTARMRTLEMGDHSHIISQHYFDCGGGVVIGNQTWITGIRTTVLTHAFDPHNGGMILEPVVLQDRAVIATCCTMLPGTIVGEGALVAAGSTTWTGQEAKGGNLHGGVPARRLSAISIPGWVYDRARYQPEGSVVAPPHADPELRTE